MEKIYHISREFFCCVPPPPHVSASEMFVIFKFLCRNLQSIMIPTQMKFLQLIVEYFVYLKKELHNPKARTHSLTLLAAAGTLLLCCSITAL